MKNKNVLVTGGAGYIGSHVCKNLFKEGFNPIVYDDFSRGHKESCKFGAVIKGCITDRNIMIKALKDFEPCAVIHCAGLAYVEESNNHPMEYYKINVEGSINIFSCMVEVGAKNLIFSSSCSIYGNAGFLPITENHDKMPLSPYAKTKYIVENILAYYDKAYEFPYISLRFFNAAGADNEVEIGEIHDPETHLIPKTIDAIYKDIEIVINGGNYPTVDGTCIRDYIHVSDLAHAHILGMRHLLKGKNSCILNLGSGKGYSCLEVINEIEKQIGKKAKVFLGANRSGDSAFLVGDIIRVYNTLGWIPKQSELKDIIKTAISWYTKNRELYT
jgi:UDP-arabinose 4-epimerase